MHEKPQPSPLPSSDCHPPQAASPTPTEQLLDLSNPSSCQEIFLGNLPTLLAAGADLAATEEPECPRRPRGTTASHGGTALHIVANNGWPRAVEALLQAGADVWARQRMWGRLGQLARFAAGQVGAAGQVWRCQAVVLKPDWHAVPPIGVATTPRRWTTLKPSVLSSSAVQQCCPSDPPPNPPPSPSPQALDSRCRTPLHAAAADPALWLPGERTAAGKQEAAALLLAAQSDPNAQDSSGAVPLLLALRYLVAHEERMRDELCGLGGGFCPAVGRLLNSLTGAGASLDIADAHGCTPRQLLVAYLKARIGGSVMDALLAPAAAGQ